MSEHRDLSAFGKPDAAVFVFGGGEHEWIVADRDSAVVGTFR